ncbi:MAG: radical SAM protein [Patescibacteria group bacterium]|jgi:MoaA/NifB/PqqE/SkfB family radical SAM enzyme
MRLNPHAKLLWNGDRVKSWLEGDKIHPILIEIAPTGYCNANCPWCFFENQKTAEKIDPAVMLKTIDELAKNGVKAINWTGGGEPTLHPQFAEFVRRAADCGIEQGLFTNGYLEIPEQEKFSWIRISLTDKGVDAIKKPRVPFGINLNQTANQTEDELKKICQEARDLGAAYFQVRPALLGSHKIQPKLTPPDYLKKYASEDFQVYTTPYKYEEAVRPKEYNKCYGYSFCPSINWKGHLGVCLYMMGDKNFIFGDLNEAGYSALWEKIPEHIKVSPACQNCCKNHEINKLLDLSKGIIQTSFL